jgi:hypothetical protein
VASLLKVDPETTSPKVIGTFLLSVSSIGYPFIFDNYIAFLKLFILS